MARKDLDLVVHVGDYIYEGNTVSRVAREHLGLEPRTLAQYRTRDAQYRRDENLQAAHAAFPWIVTWDDHEVDNNWSGEDQDPDAISREEFLARRAAAFQAYYEHLPLRTAQRPTGPDMLLHRRASFGDLAELNVLDTRQFRSDQVSCRPADSSNGYCAAALDPLTHLSPWAVGQDRENLARAQARFPGPVELAREGLIVALGARS